MIGTLRNCCFEAEHHEWLLHEVIAGMQGHLKGLKDLLQVSKRKGIIHCDRRLFFLIIAQSSCNIDHFTPKYPHLATHFGEYTNTVGCQYCCFWIYATPVVVTSVLDPLHFDAVLDPRIRFRDNGSGSGSDLKSNKFQFFFFLIFFCERFKTHNNIFFLVILSLLFTYIRQNKWFLF